MLRWNGTASNKGYLLDAMLGSTNSNNTCAVPHEMKCEHATPLEPQEQSAIKTIKVKGGYTPMLIGDRQSPLMRSLQGSNKIGRMLSATCNSPTDEPIPKTEEPRTVLLLNHLALISTFRWLVIDLPGNPRHHTHEEWRIPIDRTIFLIFLQPCRQQCRKLSSHGAQLHGQGRL